MRLDDLKLNLDKKRAGGFGIELTYLNEESKLPGIEFQVSLVHPGGQLSLEPIAIGTYFNSAVDNPGRLYFEYSPLAIFEGTAIEKQYVSIAASQHEEALFKLVVGMLKMNEAMVIEYKLEGALLPAKAKDKDARTILLKLVRDNDLEIVSDTIDVNDKPNKKWSESLAHIETKKR
ncbi:MAG: hypothetical protein HY779_02455 [Rubrobacteridae bacterium]|nr:hypothetical protein [Rubrobacteridae bacterium]